MRRFFPIKETPTVFLGFPRQPRLLGHQLAHQSRRDFDECGQRPGLLPAPWPSIRSGYLSKSETFNKRHAMTRPHFKRGTFSRLFALQSGFNLRNRRSRRDTCKDSRGHTHTHTHKETPFDLESSECDIRRNLTCRVASCQASCLVGYGPLDFICLVEINLAFHTESTNYSLLAEGLLQQPRTKVQDHQRQGAQP